MEGWEGSVELTRPVGAVSQADFGLFELTREGPAISRAFQATEKGVHKITVILAHPESGVELWGSREFFVTDPAEFPAFTDHSLTLAHWEPHHDHPDFISLRIPVHVSAAARTRHVHMHAEVHLKGFPGSPVGPVAWVAGMVTPESCSFAGEGAVCLSLSLHLGWFARAHFSGTSFNLEASGLELRHVRLKDPEQEVVVGRIDDRFMLVDAGGERGWLAEVLKKNKFQREAVAEEPQKSLLEVQMREGPLAGSWVNGGAWSDTEAQLSGIEDPESPQVLLVGGFCASAPPFPPKEFHRAISAVWKSGMDASNDKFSRRIISFTQEEGLARFASVGHSQAGNALLHLRTYYWSGMDRVTGGAVMQSTASPFHGASIMNFRQYLPSFIFCDFIQDVTPEGAEAWLRDIPAWSRSYANIAFTDHKGFFSCNPASELIMDGPCNDGVVECDRAVLHGANYTVGPMPGGYDGDHGCHLGHPYFVEHANSRDSENNRRMNDWAAREPLKLR